jgi:S1-C subfamily serine protease
MLFLGMSAKSALVGTSGVILAIPLVLMLSACSDEDAGFSKQHSQALELGCLAQASSKRELAYIRCTSRETERLKDIGGPVSLAAIESTKRKAIFADCRAETRLGLIPFEMCLRGQISAANIRQPASSQSLQAVRLPSASEKGAAPEENRVAPLAGALAALSPAELYAKVSPSVYVVESFAPAKGSSTPELISTGSGVAISHNVLLTNCHVVEKAARVVVRNDIERTEARILPTRMGDRCLLQVNAMKLNSIGTVKRYSDLLVGDRVYAVGNPERLTNTLSEGLISGLRRDNDGQYVQFNAPITFGSSGGGLFGHAGALIGITTFGKQAGALYFAIAAEEYLDLLKVAINGQKK